MFSHSSPPTLHAEVPNQLPRSRFLAHKMIPSHQIASAPLQERFIPSPNFCLSSEPNWLPMGILTEAILGVSEYHRRRPRFLCLHGFRTSGEIMRTQVMGKWPDRITARLDLFFADAPFPAEGKSEVEGIFDPPYYEWFQFNKGYTEFRNFDECLDYIEDLMIKHGPFDGLMGFSQGAALSAALPGLQAKGLALKRVPQVKHVVIIGGGKIPVPIIVEKAFDVKIECPSLHFIGELDFLNEYSESLLDAFVDPVVVRHPKGHTVPRLDDKSLEAVLGYIERIEKNLDGTELSFSNCEEPIEA